MKIKHILLALMPMCIASCSEEATFAPVTSQQEVQVTAGIGTHSRMVLSDYGEYTKSFWQNGDEISLFTSTQSNLVYSTTLNADSASASFAAMGESLKYIEGNTVYACYPEVSATADNNLIVNLPSTGSFDYNDGKLRSFCYGSDQISEGSVSFKFKHLSAFLCLTITSDMLSDATKGINNITVSTSSSEPLSIGEGDTFDFSTLTANTTHGTNTVQINTNNHVVDSLWTVYIPVLPQPAGANITITLADSEGTTLYTMTKETPTSGFQAGNVYKVGTTVSYDVAYLVDGPTFNASIKQLADGSRSINSYNYSIAKVEFLTEIETLPEQYITVSANNSPVPIYASFNPTDSLLTVFTPTKEIEIVNAESMFRCFESLHTIDFGNFNVNETTKNMSQMFNFCSALTSLDVSNWNTENVTNMTYMFYGCSALASLDVSNWNTENVTNITYMFYDCSALTSLNVSNWDTVNLTNISDMFRGCSALTSLNVSNWDTTNVNDMSYMFSGCSALTSLDVSNWDTTNVTNMSSMFSGCSALTSLDVSNWNTTNVTKMYDMFFGCSELTSLDVSNWNTTNVNDMSSMFSGCSALTSLNDVSNWNTTNVNDMSYMFCGCSELTSLNDVSNWNTTNVNDMSYMFIGCSALTSLDVSNWDTTNVTNMSSMFSGCSALTSLDVSNWNTTNVTKMYDMFFGCSELTSLDVSNWNTTNVTNMSYMFKGCSSLTSLNVSKWNTANVGYMYDMFNCCYALTNLDISNWSFNNNVYIYFMFSSCASTSQACKITATQEAKDFLLSKTSSTGMNTEWFIWGDAANDGSGFEEMPKEEW